MASASDGSPLLPPMPDFSGHNDPFSTAGDMKFHLQTLLDAKEKQLQQAGTLGQRVLAQQMELEERIRQLQEIEADKGEDDEIDREARERYRELAETVLSWDSENAHLSSAFGGSSKRFPNGSAPSPSIPFAELPREESERSKASGTSVAQSRRAKNAAHRADDVEFALEIGSGLLTEVRRLQSLLGERDKAIQDMKEEKDDLEKSVESLRTALRQQEQSADKFKEENWNLEVTLQELRTQLGDFQSTTQRLESEHKRLTKALGTARDVGDQHKNESERLQNVIEDMKAKHETDVAQARKHAAGLARDKSDLQQTIDTLKADAARAGRRFPRFGSPLTPNGSAGGDFLTPAGADGDGDGDVFGTTGGASTNRRGKMDPSAMFADEFGMEEYADLPDQSPVRRPILAPNHPTNEIEALQQRLAHAQRQINTLKGSLNREKQARIRLEAGSPGGGKVLFDEEGEEEDGDDAYEDEETVAEAKRPAKRTTTPFKVRGGRGGRGRGRGRGGITLIQRLGMAAGSPASEYNDDDSHRASFGDSPPPPVPSIPIHFSQHEDEDEQAFFSGNGSTSIDEQKDEYDRQRSPSPSGPPSNRTSVASVDGMDPVFANVLKRVPSNGSTYTASPLRQALGRSARGGTIGRRTRGGGMAYKEARPPSLVDAPEALSAELGVGLESSPLKALSLAGSPMKGEDIVEEDGEFAYAGREVETAEFGCQTEPPLMEEEKTVVLPLPPIPEPAPVAVPEKVMAEMAMQTDEEPPAVVVEKTEMGIQHVPAEPPVPIVPVRVDSGMGTDPEPELVRPLMIQAEVQTPPPEKTDMNTQTPPDSPAVVDAVAAELPRRTTITQYDRSFESTSTGDTTITRNFLAEHDVGEDEEDDGDETETGADTETETESEDYHDATQSIARSTASESREDFHSLMTVTDNDYSESEDDDESIKASRMSSVAHMSRSPSAAERDSPSQSSFYDAIVPREEVSYETVGVSADLYEPPEPIVKIIAPPKPEVKEISIQTDEWSPPPPPAPAPAPAPPPPPVAAPIPVFSPIPSPVSATASIQTSPGLYRIGSANQQFQFVPPPPPVSAAPSSAPAVTAATAAAAGVAIISTPLSGTFRELSGVLARSRTMTSDRRQSIESIVSSIAPGDDATNRSRVSSSGTGTLLSAVDKTKPPMMVLPPPPRAPPPKNMPPPSFIPERRMPNSSSGSYDDRPPRPSSPPPPELIQRATTPTFGAALNVPGRQHGSSMPPSQSGLRQLPSTSSFRSAANAASHAQRSLASPGPLSSFSVRERERREFSTTSLTSERTMASPRSSMSSDHHPYDQSRGTAEPVTPNKTADITPRAHQLQSTDPAIIHAITQTMIGEFLYKYTRRTIGKGHGQSRHKRFFWVHPYTKTLYWSSADPGSANITESSAKSAYIEGVRSVLDPNPMPPGLYQYSVVVSTPQREMKITAPTKERHDIWLNALKYLLARPTPVNITSPGNMTTVPQSPASAEFVEDERRPRMMSSPQSQRGNRNGDTWNVTPRGQRSRSQLSVGGSVGKRSGTPALEYLRWNGPESPYSPTKSFVDVPAHDEDDLDFELHDDSRSEEGFEGLENVRACCDGRHTVGHSGKHHHHHHHDHNHAPDGRQSSESQHLQPIASEMTRPVSPAWSLRSRTGSTRSHEGGGIFSWGRRDDGKLRFGSRRSTKTSTPVHDS